MPVHSSFQGLQELMIELHFCVAVEALVLLEKSFLSLLFDWLALFGRLESFLLLGRRNSFYLVYYHLSRENLVDYCKESGKFGPVPWHWP